MIARHRGLKLKLRAGYRPPSLQHTSYFSSSSVVLHAFSALCVVYSSPPGNLCCWASPWRKIVHSVSQSLTHSLNHPAYLMSQKQKQYCSIWQWYIS